MRYVPCYPERRKPFACHPERSNAFTCHCLQSFSVMTRKGNRTNEQDSIFAPMLFEKDVDKGRELWYNIGDHFSSQQSECREGMIGGGSCITGCVDACRTPDLV